MPHRIPVHFAIPVVPGDAVLLGASGTAPAGLPFARIGTANLTNHQANCACCNPRDTIGMALGALHQARARGQVAWFNRLVVLAPPENWPAVRAALTEDRLAAARYRLA